MTREQRALFDGLYEPDHDDPHAPGGHCAHLVGTPFVEREPNSRGVRASNSRRRIGCQLPHPFGHVDAYGSLLSSDAFTKAAIVAGTIRRSNPAKARVCALALRSGCELPPMTSRRVERASSSASSRCRPAALGIGPARGWPARRDVTACVGRGTRTRPAPTRPREDG